MNNTDILEEDVKNILNCCTDIETLISLDERAKEDLKNNTHNIQQQEVLTIIREFIRCKNDCSNLIAENKELKETIKNNIILVKDENGNYEELNINITDYIPKSKVEENLKKAINNEIDLSKAMFEGDFTNGYIYALQSLLGKE